MLTAHQVLQGYASGIFPMAEPEEDNAIYWYEPEIRGILLPEEFKYSKSLKREMKKGTFEFCINRNFEGTMRACAEREETWISEEIIEVYCGLQEMGYGYSFEVWQDNNLVGGLYGVAIGKVFFGESMFHKVSNTSKMALVFLIDWMVTHNYGLLDCQFITEHLKQFGAKEVTQETYLEILEKFI